MKITVYGAGYVGLVTAACLADLGNQVCLYDINKATIAALQKGIIPFYEENMDELFNKNKANGNIKATLDVKEAVGFGDIHFLCVGTPSKKSGEADCTYLLKASEDIAYNLSKDALIVVKSSVPVGTGDKVKDAISQILTERRVDINFSVASNPEFLKEGQAILDFFQPDRVVIGCEDPQSIETLRELYAPICKGSVRFLVMDNKSSELTKYAANAMLATRISFMNELALFAESMGADISHIKDGLGSDKRIGSQFLNAGCGYGGSCFPKDVAALAFQAKTNANMEFSILEKVEEVNHRQRQVLPNKIIAHFGEDLTGLTFALFGLAFKPNTDDMREAPSLNVIESLTKRGAIVHAFDPIATAKAKLILGENTRVHFFDSPYLAANGADAAIIVTEWNEIKALDLNNLEKALKAKIIYDGRNLFEPSLMAELGFDYFPIGRKNTDKNTLVPKFKSEGVLQNEVKIAEFLN